MSESAVQRAIMLGIGSRPDVRIWRNNVGQCVATDGRHIRYGVANPGGSDLVGIRRLLIGPEHLGQTIGQFLALEVKEHGRLSDEQRRFLECIATFGGLATVARSVDDATAALGPTLFDAPRRAGGAR